MNNYKFGNYICKLREENGLTQMELARRLEVSDKAVSKWENGQAFPRIDTFEKLASQLNTTVEDILSASKDGVTRVCIENNFCDVMHLDINGQLYLIRADESKWIEVTSDTIVAKITGELITEDTLESLDDEDASLKDRIMLKFAKKVVQEATSLVLQADCVYKITNVIPDSLISIELDVFDLGDKTLMFQEFQIAYPKIICGSDTQVELLNARGKNSKELIKIYKKIGLVSDLGLDFITMLLAYPLRGMYFKHLCKPSVLKKNILNAEMHKEKSEKRKGGKKVGCFSGCAIIVLIFIGFFLFDCLVLSVLFVESEKPVLIAEDYSTATYLKEEYVRIDDLPEDAYPVEFLGATVWEDARRDNLSKWDQSMQSNKVQLFEDHEGNQYLWLVENYTDSSVLLEDKEYDDFDEHYVYMSETTE